MQNLTIFKCWQLSTDQKKEEKKKEPTYRSDWSNGFDSSDAVSQFQAAENGNNDGHKYYLPDRPFVPLPVSVIVDVFTKATSVFGNACGRFLLMSIQGERLTISLLFLIHRVSNTSILVFKYIFFMHYNTSVLLE